MQNFVGERYRSKRARAIAAAQKPGAEQLGKFQIVRSASATGCTCYSDSTATLSFPSSISEC
jgi:hypothetical protein